MFPKILGLDLSRSDADQGYPALGPFTLEVFFASRKWALQATEHPTWSWGMAGLRSAANLITATETNI